LSRSLPGPEGGPGLVVDLGAQWVGPGQTEIMKLIKELDLHTVASGTPGLTSWSVAGRRSVGGGALPKVGALTLVEILATLVGLRLMYPRLPPEAPWSAKRARRWDAIPTADWLRKIVRTPAGRALTEIYIRGNTATEPAETSIYQMLAIVRGCGSLRSIWDAEEFQIAESAFEIPHRLSLPLRGRVRLDSPVRTIRQGPDSVTVEADTGVLRGRRAVVCVPPVLANEIRYDPPLQAKKGVLLSNGPMGACIKFHATYDRPFWRSQNLNGEILSADDAVSLTYDNSPKDGKMAGAIVGFVLADQARRLSALNSPDQETEILACLARFLGEQAKQPRALVVQDWGHEQWSRGAFAAHYATGVLTHVGAVLQAPCGRVHWAGTDTSPEWWGYMEGALRSANRVVAELVAQPDWEGGHD
jgi:monoamine oxidase